MEIVTVRSESPPCESRIVVGENILSKAAELLALHTYSSVYILGDVHVKGIVTTVAEACNIPPEAVLLLPGGEGIKDVSYLAQVWEFLIVRKADRRSLLIAIGGGAITDLAGFAAASYMRGIAAAYIPTTLLAQVDASIGGKSGINIAGVKNIVGSIAQPAVVLIDPTTLSTLPEREVCSGFAEIIKHGAIYDSAYFRSATVRRCTELSTTELFALIARSCAIKAAIVTSDERELGPRKLLNFGHTIGHALEAYFLPSAHNNGTPLLHGEAVAIGMYAEARIACTLGLLPETELIVLHDSLARAGLPTRLHAHAEITHIEALICSDKKKKGGTVYWTLITKIGEGTYDRVVPPEVVSATLKAIQPQS